ncbi:MAG: hypothetical protein ACLVEU_15820 [Bacteroides cellulosilyticus]
MPRAKPALQFLYQLLIVDPDSTRKMAFNRTVGLRKIGQISDKVRIIGVNY